MSKALITEAYLTDIANAIRTKLGVLTQYTPPQMAAAIESIPTGITPTGTKQITVNGIQDVTPYANVNVDVPNSYAAGDEGKVVSNGALVAQTSRSVTANGTHDTTTNDEVVVSVQPNLQSKTVTQNGMVMPDQGYDGLSSVVVNVSGGGGDGNITYGVADPVASAGSDGDVYFKYSVFPEYFSLLPTEAFDLNNWTKNAAGFTKFLNVCSRGENTLDHTGGSGYERIFVSVPVDLNADYVFGLDYYSPSGVSAGYSGQLNIKASFAAKSAMESSSELSSFVGQTNLSRSAESAYSNYTLTFNSGNNSSVYLVIDLNIRDGNNCILKFKNIVFYKVGTPPIEVDGKTITTAYLKQGGTWVNAIGADIA